MAKGSDQDRPELRLTSSGAAIGGALLGGLGLLIPLYATANRDLAGFRFISAIVLAAGAIVLVLEGVQRIRSGKRGRLPCGLGAGLGLASLLLALLPANSDASGDGEGLRLNLRPTTPAIFGLAFKREIPLPRAEEGWAELRRRGGIDIGDSHFQMILANESPRPISILAVRVEVLGSEPMPHGTEAHQYTQGDEGIDRFLAFLPDGKEGSIGQVYVPGNRALGREELEAETPFFESRYVLLRPGEVYPAALTVEADTPRTITYRLVAEGEPRPCYDRAHAPRLRRTPGSTPASTGARWRVPSGRDVLMKSDPPANPNIRQAHSSWAWAWPAASKARRSRGSKSEPGRPQCRCPASSSRCCDPSAPGPVALFSRLPPATGPRDGKPGT